MIYLLLFLLFNILYSSEKPIVFVSIMPQVEFMEKIAKDKFEIRVFVGNGASPHNYEPTPSQMMALSRAKAWLAIGIDFERALKPKVRKLYPGIKIVDLTNGVKFRTLEEHSHYEDEEEHEEETFDPHIWLGYEQVKMILSNTLIVLKELSPENSLFFENNYKNYISEIDRTFDELRVKLKPMAGKTVIVYHPAFGYFFDTFGIKQKAVEVRGKEPSQKEVVNLINLAKKDNVKTIFIQKQFSKNSAKVIARAIKGKVVEIDPLAKEWLNNIKFMADAIIKSK